MDEGWWHSAACKDQPTQLFYVTAGQRGVKAKAFCKQCPVVEECLADALAREVSGERYGVWGGLTAFERRKKYDGLEDKPKPKATICPAGHPLTEDNLVPSGRGYRCKACTLQRPPRTHCAHGFHEWTEENVYTHNGKSYCRPCQRDRTRNHRRAKV